LNLRGAFILGGRTNVFLSGKAETMVETRQVFLSPPAEDSESFEIPIPGRERTP